MKSAKFHIKKSLVDMHKKMGSRKLILLPQVLPIHTFDSAYHVFPYMRHPALPNLPGYALPLRVLPNLFLLNMALLGIMSRTVLHGLSTLNATLANFA